MEKIELILCALDEYNEEVEKNKPKSIKKLRKLSIEHEEPYELMDFIKENNIPKECYFDIDEYIPVIAWFDELPVTEEYIYMERTYWILKLMVVFM